VSDSQADLPPLPSQQGALDRALALVEFLRGNCPWDAAQTPHSLRRYLLEEAHEVIDAIERGDAAGLRDELGDLLLNLAFQVVIAEERGDFDRFEVVMGLEAKMRRRHPHLYGEGEAKPWEVSKAEERGSAGGGEDSDGGGVLAGMLPAADPLRDAQRVQERVATVGFDWPEPRGAWEKVREEIDEVGAELDEPGSAALEDEIGDLLFSVVNLARLSRVDAPTALARANRKFRRRFQALERLAGERGVVVGDAGLEVLDRLWGDAKREER
jgi:nucleoside triphosphate diphosphatase